MRNDIRVRNTQSHCVTARTELQDSVLKNLSNNSTINNGFNNDPVNVSSPVKKSSKSVIEMRVLETNQEFKYLEDSIENINTKLIALVSSALVVFFGENAWYLSFL